MNGLNGFAIGGMLVIWIAVLATMMFRRDGKALGSPRNLDVLLPVGTALSVWMWIFAMVVFSS